MKYLFILDYARLDQGAFLKHMARSLSRLSLESFMMIHADSGYTTRITETGVLTEIARVRAIKELNHRLTALFADEGIPMIAINGYQRKTIVNNKTGTSINADYLRELGSKTNVLLSNLVEGADGAPVPMPLGELATRLHEAMSFSHIIVFDAQDRPESLIFAEKQENNPPETPPKELQNVNLKFTIIQPSELNAKERFQNKLTSNNT